MTTTDHDPLSAPVTVILGDEHYANLKDALRAALIEIGARLLEQSWGVGGSQEIESFEVSIDNVLLTVEAETFRGLTLTGARPLVERIAEVVRRNRSHPTSPA